MIFKQRLRVRRSEQVRRQAETGVSWQKELTKPWGGEERAQEFKGKTQGADVLGTGTGARAGERGRGRSGTLLWEGLHLVTAQWDTAPRTGGKS